MKQLYYIINYFLTIFNALSICLKIQCDEYYRNFLKTKHDLYRQDTKIQVKQIVVVAGSSTTG